MDSLKKKQNKSLYILPNLFTVGSMFAAFLAIIWTHNGSFYNAAIAVLVSALLDGMDGKIARLTHSASDFGVQLDSLADAIAFGTAPAFLVYQWRLLEFGRLGLAVSFLFMACGVLRLARFNVMTGTISKKFFIGLPIPAAGCTVALLVLFNQYLPRSVLPVLSWVTLVLTFVLGLLMVSRIRYFAFKEFGGFRLRPFYATLAAVLLFALIVIEPRIMGFSLFIGYLLSGPIYTFFFFRRRGLGHKQDAAGPGTGASGS